MPSFEDSPSAEEAPKTAAQLFEHLIAVASRHDQILQQLFAKLPGIEQAMLAKAEEAVDAAFGATREDVANDAEKRIGEASARISVALNQRIDEQVKAMRGLKKQGDTELAAMRATVEQARPLLAQLADKLAAEAVALSDTQRAEVERIVSSERVKFAESVSGIQLQLRGAYGYGVVYRVGDIVSWRGSSYVASVNGELGEPKFDSKEWQILAMRGVAGANGSGEEAAAKVQAELTAHLTDPAAHAALFAEKAPLNSPQFTGAVVLGDGAQFFSLEGDEVLGIQEGFMFVRNIVSEDNIEITSYRISFGGPPEMALYKDRIDYAYEGGGTINIAGANGILTKQGNGSGLTGITAAQVGAQQAPVVVSANQQAEVDTVYHNVATATYTDPAVPVEGKGFTVVVRNGTATIGGTAYSQAGLVIRRIFHSGSYANQVDRGAVAATATTAGTVPGIGGTATGNAATVGQLATEWRPDVLNQGTANHANGGSVSVVNSRRRFNTGTTPFGRSHLRWTTFTPGNSTGHFDFSKPAKMVVVAGLSNNILTGQTLTRFVCGNNGANLSGPLAARGFSIEFRGVGSTHQLWILGHDGTALTEHDTGLGVTQNHDVIVELTNTGTGQMLVAFNRTPIATPFSGGPTNSTSPTESTLFYAEMNNGDDTVSRFLDLSNFSLIYL
jgi:hypothetical protein